MRPVLIGVALGLLGASAGCLPFRSSANDPRVDNRTWSATPKAEELVRHVNANAQLIKSLECQQLSIDGRADGQAMGAEGSLACQKPATPGAPPNFRMDAVVLNSKEVDIGSNGQEFWYWVRRHPQPYVFHCSYADYRAGKAQMPFPFQPEWIVEALGITEFDTTKSYHVRDGARAGTLELIESTVTPQGQPVYKITMFSKPDRGRAPQVIGRVLTDAKGKTIYQATIETKRDGLSGAELPHIVQLKWPQEKMELKLTLNKVQANVTFDEARAASVFSRRGLGGIQGYDLARGAPDASGVRQAGGVGR